MPRYVQHNLNGEVFTDFFADAHTSTIEGEPTKRALILRDSKGKAIASFAEANVIKCTDEPPRKGAKLTTGERRIVSHYIEQPDATRAALLDNYSRRPGTSGPLIRALRTIEELL
jgi:hypothetical protein